MFQRVSVFAGSFSLDSVEQVCADEACPVDQTIDLVSALVDKSLVVCEIAGDSARYRLLDTIRQFARAELQRGGRLEEFRERAAVHFVLMAEAAEPRIFGGPDDLRLQASLEAEAQNFRAVGEWCREDPSRSSWALRLGAALYWFWFSQGRFHEGRQLLDSALEADAGAAPVLRARALSARGYMAMWQGDVRGMRPPLEESLRLMRDGGDGRLRAVAIAGMAMAALAERNLAEATEHIDRASALVETLTPPGVYLPFVLYWRGTIAIQAGERQVARAVLERAVSAGRELGHPRAIAHPLYALANLEIREGRHTEAMNHLRESLQLHDRLGDGWGMFLALAGMAAAAADQDAEQAARLLGASEAVRSRLGIQMLHSVRPDHDDLVHRVRAAVGPGRFEALWRKGHAWSRPELLAELIGPQRPDSRHPAGGRSAAVETSPELRVAALGRFEVYRGHTHVDERSWGSAKARELLAYLLAHPEGCTRERAGAALWPDASDEQVRNNFHVTVHRLRRALGDAEYIVIDRERYAINPARRVEFDAREFAVEARRLIEQLRTPGTVPPWAAATLARYRGEFLEHERAAEWHLDIRDELGQLYEQALVTVADALVATGRAADSLAYYRTLVSRDRTSERAARGLMRACLATADRDTARRTYERLVLALREDLDTAPEPQTVDLARTLDATRDA